MLLPPCTVPIPTEAPSHRQNSTFHSSSYFSTRRSSVVTTARTVAVLVALAIFAWHFYITFGMVAHAEDVSEQWE